MLVGSLIFSKLRAGECCVILATDGTTVFTFTLGSAMRFARGDMRQGGREREGEKGVASKRYKERKEGWMKKEK